MGPMDEAKNELVSRLVELIKDISGLPECRNVSKKWYNNLVRRVKLLGPLFDELKDSDEELGDDVVLGLDQLKIALIKAKDLLRSINEGSKIFQVLDFFMFYFLRVLS